MPNLSATPNRNTLNQRASRARKQEYIASLECKVREYEQRGISATSEVQNAARQVADENRMLKDELTVLREHVKCLEDALMRNGFVGIVGEDDGIEKVSSVDGVRGATKGTKWWVNEGEEEKQVAAALRLKSDPDAVLDDDDDEEDNDADDADDNNNNNDDDDGLRRRVRDDTVEIEPDVVAGVETHKKKKQKTTKSRRAGIHHDQYPSPPDEEQYSGSDAGRQKRTRLSVSVSRPFDEQEAASILLSTATTPITYEHNSRYGRPTSTSTSSASSITSSNQNQHHHQQYYPSRSKDHSTYQSYSDHYPPTFSNSHNPLPRRSSPNSTPCEEAALIIASMRGMAPSEGDQTEIYNDLGCQARERAQECKVDNVRLFGLMAGERS